MSEEHGTSVQYARDKPKDCEYCFFWNGSKAGCQFGGGQNCAYVIAPKIRVNDRCFQCPYSKSAPCIGWCTADVLEEMRMKRKIRG